MDNIVPAFPVSVLKCILHPAQII